MPVMFTSLTTAGSLVLGLLFAVVQPKGRALTRSEIADLYRRTGALVLRRCQRLLRDDSEAEDVMQEVFVRAMRYGTSIDAEQVPLAWLYRTAERCCFDRMKTRGREPVGEGVDVAASMPFPSSVRQLEAADLVERFFHQLKPKLQQVAMLHYVDGLPQEQIAEQLGWSRRTVGKKLKQVRRTADRLALGAGVDGKDGAER